MSALGLEEEELGFGRETRLGIERGPEFWDKTELEFLDKEELEFSAESAWDELFAAGALDCAHPNKRTKAAGSTKAKRKADRNGRIRGGQDNACRRDDSGARGMVIESP